jgi:hypothetical protein
VVLTFAQARLVLAPVKIDVVYVHLAAKPEALPFTVLSPILVRSHPCRNFCGDMMYLLTVFSLFFGLLGLASNSAFAQTSLAVPTPATSEASQLTWKAALMTGDDSIEVFDNARKTLTNVFLKSGITPDHIRELSMNPDERLPGVLPSSAVNLSRALQGLSVGDHDACLIHMTSHGSPKGFYLRNGPSLTPATLNTILDRACGDRPTVVLVSACYSGVFVDHTMLKPNRIILTAARADRTSFGCSAEKEYTYWDGCLIDSLSSADTWKSLYGAVQGCVKEKESDGRFIPSLPQAYFGAQVANLKIPKDVAKVRTTPANAAAGVIH